MFLLDIGSVRRYGKGIPQAKEKNIAHETIFS